MAMASENDSSICDHVALCLFISAGVAGEHAPRSVFRCVVGRARQPRACGNFSLRPDQYIGEEAFMKRGVLTLFFPITKGLVTNWDDMELIWHHVFYNELCVEPEAQHSVLLTEALMNPKANRERMTQMMFESFNVKALYVISRPVLSLYPSGRTTGCVLHSGGDTTQAVPIYEGYVIPHAVVSLDIGGRDLTRYLIQMLTDRSSFFTYPVNERREPLSYIVANEVKETLCFVALDFEEEMKTSALTTTGLEKSFEIDNEDTIMVGNERFRCAEPLFQPHLVGLEMVGIADSTYQAIMKSDVQIHKDLYSNIVMSGGTTMFPRIAERMSKEMTAIVPASMKVKIVAPLNRKNSVWMGGSIVASLSVFQKSWIRLEEYDDIGPTLVHDRCM